MQKIYLSQKEVCAELGVSRFYFTTYIRDNFGKPHRPGKRDVYTHSQIAAYRAKVKAKEDEAARDKKSASGARIRPLNAKQLAAFR